LEKMGEAEFMDYFVPKLEKDVEYLRAWPVFCPKHIIFKSQNPGHVGCEHYTQPQNDTSSLRYSDPRWGGDKYNWVAHTYTDAHVFKFFRNDAQRNISLQMRRAQLGVLDMSPIYQRPDGHAGRDCLHYCSEYCIWVTVSTLSTTHSSGLVH